MELQWPQKIDAQYFLQHYWQVRPLLMRAAFPDFESPLSPDELGGLATDEEITSRIILKEGDENWHCRFGPFAEEDLTGLPESDWSLLVSGIEKQLPDFRQWLEPFRFIPDWRIDDLMISYAPEGASVGAHIDNYDVFLLQAAGRREWSINEDPEADQSYLDNPDIRILSNFKAENTWVLEPGDILYLPPGVPHHGVSLDNDCMTWSIGFRAPSHKEIITEIAQALVENIPESAFYSDPSLLARSHSGEISANAIDRVREIWNTYVHPDSETFTRASGELLTGGRSAAMTEDENEDDNEHDAEQSSETQDAALSKLIKEHLHWERNSETRMAFIREHDEQGDHALLFIDGTTHTCTLGLAQYLTDHFDYTNEGLQSFLNTEDNVSVVRWLTSKDKLLADNSQTH